MAIRSRFFIAATCALTLSPPMARSQIVDPNKVPGISQTPSLDPEVQRQLIIESTQAALDNLPRQNEFVEPPGSVPEGVATEQIFCMAGKFNVDATPQEIKIRQDQNRTDISVLNSNKGFLSISTETDSGVLTSKCNCGPDGGPVAFGLRRSTYQVVSSEGRVSISTYVSTDVPGTHLSLLSSVEFPEQGKDKQYIDYGQHAQPVEDGSLAHAARTLEAFSMQATYILQGNKSRPVTPDERTHALTILQTAISKGTQCHILNYGGG